MTLKNKIRAKLRERYGDFETHLEHKYETKLTENLIGGNLDDKMAWLTYNQVILELKYSLKDMLKVKELQYGLTEDCNPKEICVSIIEDIKCSTPELERLYYKILSF